MKRKGRLVRGPEVRAKILEDLRAAARVAWRRKLVKRRNGDHPQDREAK